MRDGGPDDSAKEGRGKVGGENRRQGPERLCRHRYAVVPADVTPKVDRPPAIVRRVLPTLGEPPFKLAVRFARHEGKEDQELSIVILG